jgi:hypothetical protein
MYVPICDRGTWRIRTNEERNNLYRDTDIVTDIMMRGLERLGHLIRMESNRITRVLLGAKLEAKRKVGRPKLKWLDDLQAGLKMTGINGWRRKAQNRSE